MSDDKLQALLNAAVDAIILISSCGKISSFNHSAERLFGYQEKEVTGKNISILMPAPYASEHDSYLENYQSTKKKRIIGVGRNVKALKKNGEVFPIYLSVGEISKGSETGYVGIIRDLSEQVQAQTALREAQERLAHVTRLNTMGEMAAGIAHEVNQPLSAITSYCSACQRFLKNGEQTITETPDTEGLSDKISETLGKINQQAARAAEVIKRLRKFVKQGESQWKLANICQVIKQTVELVQIDTRLMDHPIQLQLNVDAQVEIDEIQIQQVLINLLRNAIDSVEQNKGKPIKLLLQEKVLQEKADDQRYLEIIIQDSGAGINTEQAKKLFTPFHTTKKNGMGIGLSICQTIITAHQGKIWYEPNPNGGSEFHFTLPIIER